MLQFINMQLESLEVDFSFRWSRITLAFISFTFVKLIKFVVWPSKKFLIELNNIIWPWFDGLISFRLISFHAFILKSKCIIQYQITISALFLHLSYVYHYSDSYSTESKSRPWPYSRGIYFHSYDPFKSGDEVDSSYNIDVTRLRARISEINESKHV